MIKLNRSTKRAIIGGVVSACFAGIGYFLVGSLSEYEAKQLIQSSVPGVNMLCNTVVLASATIMALLLTLLGLSSGSESRLKTSHYQHVKRLGKWDATLFITAIIFFQVTNIPLVEADNLPEDWYNGVYWLTLGVSSALVGGIVTVILMLYSTIKVMTDILGKADNDHPLIVSDDDSDS
ncbi:MAG TPA: hypothetical protein VJ949_01580 [Cryomorphaceae bacterium]|nr:hypothetical protein [Cryomorphaceae bacterium]